MPDLIDPHKALAQEAARLAALARYSVLDTEAEESFDRITRLAGALVDAPIVAISLVDAERQWFKSVQGLRIRETPRDISFCAHAIEGDGPMVVEDALQDTRFRDNPLVRGDPGIRFYAGMPLQVADGSKLGTLCVIDTVPRRFGEAQLALLQDLSRMVVDQLELRRVATTDSLTGALTRGFFLSAVEREIERAREQGHDLCLVILDLDHFKAINDTHGHLAGDVVLRRTVAIAMAALRRHDLFGRIGGEEFALCLPDTTPAEAAAVAERLRAHIAATPFAYAGRAVAVTASFGVAGRNRAEGQVLPLLKRADDALYRAKLGGRNRIAVAD